MHGIYIVLISSEIYIIFLNLGMYSCRFLSLPNLLRLWILFSAALTPHVISLNWRGPISTRKALAELNIENENGVERTTFWEQLMTGDVKNSCQSDTQQPIISAVQVRSL